MLTSDIITQTNEFSIIMERCSVFISNSNRIPIFKNLPTSYSDCKRVKVRKQKTQDYISTPFNEAFDEKTYNLRQRAIFTNGKPSFIAEHDTHEPFYIFPIDGYKFIYSKEVKNSTTDYKTVYEAITNKYGNNCGNQMLTDILKFSYTSTNLAEGIVSGSEIILYNIPFYYAVKVSSISSYHAILK
jgi:hypothetical protein